MTELVLRSTDVPVSFAEQMHMATVLADSTLLPSHLRKQPANVLVVLQGARALDVPAFWALQSMHVVDGKLGMAAELMRALAIRAGHDVTVLERSVQRAVVEVTRKDKNRSYKAEFTVQDARDAELLGKTNWRHYLKSMLVARATSIAIRDECPDVLFGVVYTPEELGAVNTDESGAVIDGEAVETRTTPADPADRVPLDRDTVGAMYQAIQDTEDADRLRRLWKDVAAMGALDELWPTSLGDLVSLRRWLTQRAEEIDAIEKARVADEEYQARVADAPVAVVVEPTVVVDTEHARSLREAAAASWAVQGEQAEHELTGGSPHDE